MTELIWSPQSIRDIESIREYIAQDSPSNADLVVRKIVAAVQRLIPFPKSGRIVPERNAPDIREVIVPPYRVVYRLRGNTVEKSFPTPSHKTPSSDLARLKPSRYASRGRDIVSRRGRPRGIIP